MNNVGAWDAASLSAALVMGLMGAGHCFGMCGGIMSALSFALGPTSKLRRLWLLGLYNTGRIVSYALLGALAAGAAGMLPATGWPVARTLAGIMLILMGLYLGKWSQLLLHLERLAHHVWRWLKPLGNRFVPIRNGYSALLLGMIWGWLPCGLVYSALAFAAVQASPAWGATTMLAFGVGTWPAVLAGGIAASSAAKLLNNRPVRVLLAAAFIGFGLWTIGSAWVHTLAHDRHQHGTLTPLDRSHPIALLPRTRADFRRGVG